MIEILVGLLAVGIATFTVWGIGTVERWIFDRHADWSTFDRIGSGIMTVLIGTFVTWVLWNVGNIILRGVR